VPPAGRHPRGWPLPVLALSRRKVTVVKVRSAEVFASLHRAGEPLLLANAWDVASAVAVEAAGARAIATTSAGVAWSLGVPDAAWLGAERAAAVIGRIAAAVSVPVSADIEAGYGDSPDAVAATVAAVVRAGAVGVNLEDRRDDASLFGAAAQAERLAAARAAAGDVPVWINARTDVFLSGACPSIGAGLAVALERAGIYQTAGADSLFVPGLVDVRAIAELAAGPLPVAVMAWPGAPMVSELAAAGVVRISLGSAIAQAAYGLAARAAAELFTKGTYDVTAGGVEYRVMNDALARTTSRPAAG
jgi:2-methylisocitrate lyase-like PEP mutase family enzyme